MNQQVEDLRVFRSLPKVYKVVDHGGSTVTVIQRKFRTNRRIFSQATWQVVKAMEAAERVFKKKVKKTIEETES